MRNIQMRIGNLELRTNQRQPTMEIVQWGDSFCWTLALWHVTEDGGCLSFVSDRPFGPKVSTNDFWKLAKLGQEFIQEVIEDRIYVSE